MFKFTAVLLVMAGAWIWIKNKNVSVAGTRGTQFAGGFPVQTINPGCLVDYPTTGKMMTAPLSPKQNIVPITEAAYYTKPGKFQAYRPAIAKTIATTEAL